MALGSTQDNKQRVVATVNVFYDYVASDTGAFRLVFESDLTSEPAVREHVDRVTIECAAMITEVIHDDTGLPDEASRLLAVSLVGMAQVSARFWLGEAGVSRTRPKKPIVISTLVPAAARRAASLWLTQSLFGRCTSNGTPPSRRRPVRGP